MRFLLKSFLFILSHISLFDYSFLKDRNNKTFVKSEVLPGGIIQYTFNFDNNQIAKAISPFQLLINLFFFSQSNFEFIKNSKLVNIHAVLIYSSGGRKVKQPLSNNGLYSLDTWDDWVLFTTRNLQKDLQTYDSISNFKLVILLIRVL